MRKRNRILLLLASLAALGAASSVLVYYNVILMEDRQIPMDVKVGDKIGFNTRTDALHFGTVYQGGESRRQLKVQNTNQWPVTVSVYNSGNISPFVLADKTAFLLRPYENTTILYTVSVPQKQGFGIYNGTSRVIVKRQIFSRTK
jgi:hypothetical protein